MRFLIASLAVVLFFSCHRPIPPKVTLVNKGKPEVWFELMSEWQKAEDLKLRIGLQPIGQVDPAYLNLLQTEISSFYKARVYILDPIKFPRRIKYRPRNRDRADRAIDYLSGVMPDTLDHLMGVTEKDISIMKKGFGNWGILGYAHRPGPCSIVSTFRLPGSASSIYQVEDRLAKVALHEIGHNLGLNHCVSSRTCLMRDARGTVRTVDKEEKQFCRRCAYQVRQWLDSRPSRAYSMVP